MPGNSGRHHSLVRTIIKTFKCPRHLYLVEIGTYSGNGAVNIIELLQKKEYEVSYFGFDLFETIEKMDLSVSNPAIHQSLLNNKDKTLKTVSGKNVYEKISKVCKKVSLIVGDTKETLRAHCYLLLLADVVYIDGGHDYETVKSDWENVKKFCCKDTLVIFDDVGMPGVSRLMKEIGMKNFSNNRCSFVLTGDE